MKRNQLNFKVYFFLFIFLSVMFAAFTGYLGFGLGRGYEKGIFLSNHIYYLERLFFLLNELAKQKKYKELSESVRIFNYEWKKDMQSPDNIARTVRMIEAKIEKNRSTKKK